MENILNNFKDGVILVDQSLDEHENDESKKNQVNQGVLEIDEDKRFKFLFCNSVARDIFGHNFAKHTFD